MEARNRMIDNVKNQNASFSGQLHKDDGGIDIEVAADGMTVQASFFPPRGEGKPLDSTYVAELLARLGVTDGVRWDELTELIFTINTERKILRTVTIANGIPPKAEFPEHIQLEERFLATVLPDDAIHKVDWKERSSVVLVRKGEIIGHIIEAQAGVVGRLVTGGEIPFSKAAVQKYIPGTNILREANDLVAGCDGKLITDGGRLAIEEVLHIKGDVDFHVGHISFPGDVVIDGSISPGFRVYSGGSITVKATMDAFDVSAKKDLHCGQGIIGKQLGHIRVGGSLHAKFIENAHVAVREDMDVPGAIVGCHLYCLGKLRMGEKGRIVGGEISAKDGVSCGWIGGKTNPATSINAGVDFIMQQKLDQAIIAMQQMSGKYQGLVQLAQTRPEPAVIILRDALEAKLKTLSSSIGDLNAKVDSNTNAIIEVRNSIYPGAIISICHISTVVKQEIKAVRFRLDAQARKIVIEKL